MKTVKKMDYSSNMNAVVKFYGDDFDENELSTQLEIFSSNYPRDGQEIVSVKDILKYLQGLSTGQRVLLKQVCWLARLILALMQLVKEVFLL